jgi:NADPH:quinone reductase-like Zn-dependent oxidoreductase
MIGQVETGSRQPPVRLSTGRKVVVHRAGGYEELRLEEHPLPVPGPGEVRVATVAVGVNYADTAVRMGLYSSAQKYVGWPITPGFEYAGRIDQVGSGVSDPTPGDEVFGITRFGGYATHVVVPRGQVFRLPPVRMEEAAGLPAVFMTAYYALFELANVRAGAHVLVHSAAGGMGGALLQLCRLEAIRAVGAVGASHKVDVARTAGAVAVIDKSREDLWRAARALAPEGYDLVLDANGASTLRQSYRSLRPGGKLIVYGFHSMMPRQAGRPSWLKLAVDYLRTPRFNPFRMVDENRSVLAFNVSYLFHRVDLISDYMGRLTEAFSEGRLHPPPVTTYPMSDVAGAHRAIASRQTVGKLVLLPSS